MFLKRIVIKLLSRNLVSKNILKDNQAAHRIQMNKVTLINSIKLKNNIVEIQTKSFNKYSHSSQKIKLSSKRKENFYKSFNKHHSIQSHINFLETLCFNFSKKDILKTTKGKRFYISYPNNFLINYKQFNT